LLFNIKCHSRLLFVVVDSRDVLRLVLNCSDTCLHRDVAC
jgi:hypothetical protein